MENEKEKSSKASVTNTEDLKIDINFDALVELFSVYLYKDKSAAIRELLSNANDSLIIRKRETGFDKEDPMIRLWLDSESASLIVKDNGSGMSRQDLIEYLSVVGSSFTRAFQNKATTKSFSADELIGRFGVGFLSAFIIADKIIVDTRKTDHPGYRWESKGSRVFSITEIDNIDYGTTITLHLKKDIIHEWKEAQIKMIVLENARNFVFPIYWGLKGKEKLNESQAPWYSEKRPDENDIENFKLFLANYDERFSSVKTALEIIPLYDDDIRGVVYIPSFTAIQFVKLGVLDLYCKRVFVTKDNSDIVPSLFSFIKGIVDCSSFRLTASRDEVLKDDYNFKRVEKFIEKTILERFQYLAQCAEELDENEKDKTIVAKAELCKLRLQNIMDQYSYVIKQILVEEISEGRYNYDDQYILDFQNFIPFKSSMHATTTLPNYLERMKSYGKENEIYILRTDEDYAAYRSITEQVKYEFIIVLSSMEEQYVKRYCDIIGARCISAGEVLPNSFPKIPAEGEWKEILRFFNERLSQNEFSLSVFLSDFKPESIPGRLFADRSSDGARRVDEFIKELGEIDKDDPMYKELEKLKSRRPHSLYLNQSNPTLKRIVELLSENIKFNFDKILRMIFHNITIAAGHHVHVTNSAELQNHLYLDMLSDIKELHDCADAITKLNIAKEQYKEAQEEINVLRQRLSEFTPREEDQNSYTKDVFFIRPMKRDDQYEWIPKKIGEIFKNFGFNFIDPKELKLPGNILQEILTYLKKSKFVIADISDINNANIYYEVGYVYGVFPNKLILIAHKDVIDKGQLPFDFKGQRVLDYGSSVPEFDVFQKDLEEIINNLIQLDKKE
ncbi:MAG: ATP-binding protein [Candidatus Hodarchaeota archaeon]